MRTILNHNTDAPSDVKRHSKLTPWRQRKLTPEETAYVDRLPAVHRVP